MSCNNNWRLPTAVDGETINCLRCRMSGITVPPSAAADLADAGGRALKLQTDTPHLVSMGGDRLSTSVTLHPLPPGRLTNGLPSDSPFFVSYCTRTGLLKNSGVDLC